ncbi:glucosaminidase domain-containing protein [Paraburkholderia sp. C35]|uniref:glycoside hydrolase family 73 protein n=1 Tax=Paraburkholderia sp. C35 TaxID=2126993 RepID=UPI000D68FE5A|nr:glucosaminidase domain-containing protein [Paraburkholderia sp. C35]
MTPQQFIAAVSPAARTSMATTKIPASFTVAEAALESGWGVSQLSVKAMNLFGIKADASWTGPTLTMQTREFLNGQWVMVPASWRVYSDWLGSISDHAQFLLTNPRYKSAFSCTSGTGFARAVAAAGYATDPDYASKIIAIINVHGLQLLDLPT